MTTSITMRNSADNEDVVVQGEDFVDCVAEGARFDCAHLTDAVSYTHLTLPTILLV